jgi:hypothetical protein
MKFAEILINPSPGVGDEVHCHPRSAPGNAAAIYSCGGMKMLSENKGTPEILTIAPEEFQLMQSAVLDGDGGEALRLLKKFVKRLKEQKNRGLKSHLG